MYLCLTHVWNLIEKKTVRCCYITFKRIKMNKIKRIDICLFKTANDTCISYRKKNLSLLNLFVKANARVETFFVKIIIWRQITEINCLCNISLMS